MKLNLSILLLACCLSVSAKIKVEKGSQMPQTEYAASLLKALDGKYTITLRVAATAAPAEGFTIERKGRKITVTGNDGPGVIYGVNRLKEYYLMNRSYDGLTTITEAPEMVLREPVWVCRRRSICPAIGSMNTLTRRRISHGSTTKPSGSSTSTCWLPTI